ncbi:phage tail protein [Oceanobacillus sojae]|uniref:Uncharacterized protein n=1 Tax=Oceanobacillus sojae TaxID=582851 RepID=A0A511ZII6_9BACI|nr:phage tail protein [Oceanobacillus sojae]GEN87258.1 hypothetical protein OSO01_19970 [Oceanobacillus sojae]
MYVVDLSNNEYMIQATHTITGELNANQSISMKILPTKTNRLFIDDISEMWSVVDNNDIEYKIVYCKKKGEGNQMTVDIKGIPLFFDVFDNDRIYERYDEHMTANVAFTHIFKDTEFTFVLVDSFPAVEWEGFGEGESKLETFKRALDRYGAEFRISGSTVFLEKQTGRDLSVMYRHRFNASNIVQENDAEENWTYIRGYGDYEDGEDAGWETAKLKGEYKSPLAKIIGKRHAPPLKDGRLKIAAEMDRKLRDIVNNSLKITITADIHDLRNQGYPIAQTQLGDRVFIIDERIGLNDEVRIVEQSVTKNWKGEVVDISLTFGTESLTKRYQSNMRTATKNINDILSGRKQIPLSSLDRRVQDISAIINGNNDSVFKYMPNGVIGWNGDDPNYMTRYVGDAIGFSIDGGKTYGTAMSAKLGIVADYITTGTLRSIIIEAVEIYGSKFYSENANSWLEIVGGNVHLELSTGSYVNLSPTGIYAYNTSGDLRFQADLSFVSSAAFGTVNTNVYLGSYTETRSVTYDSLGGDGAIDSYDYTDVRAKHFYGNKLEVNWGVGNVDHLYLSPRAAGEVRITAGQTTDTWLDLRSRGLYATYLDKNTNHGTGSDIYVRPTSSGELKITALNTTTTYRPIRAQRYLLPDGSSVFSAGALSLLSLHPSDNEGIDLIKGIDLLRYTNNGRPLYKINGNNIAIDDVVSILVKSVQELDTKLNQKGA